MAEELSGPSERTLDDIPVKVAKFLAAIRKNRSIRRTLFTKGLTLELRRRAWDLLKLVIGENTDPGEPDPDELEDLEISKLITALDQLDEKLFKALNAILEFNHPKYFIYILNGLGPSTKIEAVLGLDRLTKRIETLRDDPDKTRQDPATREADLAALTTLAQRGYNDNYWRDLRGKIDRVLGDREDSAAPPTSDPSDAEREKALILLFQWFKEWSTIAHQEITRKDQLIALGLAKPKKAKVEPTPPTKP